MVNFLLQSFNLHINFILFSQLSLIGFFLLLYHFFLLCVLFSDLSILLFPFFHYFFDSCYLFSFYFESFLNYSFL